MPSDIRPNLTGLDADQRMLALAYWHAWVLLQDQSAKAHAALRARRERMATMTPAQRRREPQLYGTGADGFAAVLLLAVGAIDHEIVDQLTRTRLAQAEARWNRERAARVDAQPEV